MEATMLGSWVGLILGVRHGKRSERPNNFLPKLFFLSKLRVVHRISNQPTLNPTGQSQMQARVMIWRFPKLGVLFQGG